MAKSEDLWTPYKELYRTINYYLTESNENVNITEFEDLLKKHKQNFFALLQNPPKNPKNREELKKGLEDGITVKEMGHQILSKDLYQEAIIISDMYELNEFVALDLLCTAQIQMPYHYGLPRGLVAVLLYYEGRKALVSSLLLLVQARRGVSWGMNIKEDFISFITTYTSQLMENGLFNRIFELLRNLDLNKEIEKLQENVALGGPRHRRQVIDLFNDIKRDLAEIVFLWSAQCGLPKEPTLGLINFLKQAKIEEDAVGIMDDVSVFLILALLSALDLSFVHTREDSDLIAQRLPILTEKDYVQTVCAELSPSKPKWVNEGLQATAMFGLAVTIATLRGMPQYTDFAAIADKDVEFLNAAIDLKIFEFFNYKLLNSKTLYTDQLYIKRIHYLFTDFIVQMFSKVKELRIKADETARMMQVYVHEGLEPPTNLPRHFVHFMEAIAKFYGKDPLNLQLCLDYWCPTEMASLKTYSSRSTPRSLSLFKFIKLSGDLIPSMLFVSFLNMLGSLSSSPQAARNCFNMLKQSGTGFNSNVSWDHFFISFNQYYNSLRQEMPAVTETWRNTQTKGITPQEIEGLQAVLKLIRTIAEQDDFSRLALCEHPGWSPLMVFLGLVSCSIIIPLKAELLLTLAALSNSSETAVQMWNNLESSQILVTIPTTSNYQSRGIQTELDEVESRTECYPLTRALLKLLDVLTDFGIPRTLGAGPRKPGFDPYLTFIVNSVFLKFNTRSYQNSEERWIVGAMCLKLLEKFLLQYDPQAADFANNNEFNSPPGFHLMLQLNSKSEFLSLILYIIEEGQKLFQQYARFPGQKYVEECTLRCLNLLERSLALQSTFFNFLTSSSSSIMLTHMSKLLLIINPRSNHPDHCLNIAKYVCYQYLLPQHALVSVKILLYVTNSPSLHIQFLNILLSNDKESKLIRSGFVECLDGITAKLNNSEAIKETILKLLKQCLAYNTPNLSHFLLGFDMKHDISQTLFQQPGVLDFPRNCLHSIFTILKSSITKGINIIQPPLLESAYNMLYMLCANYKTSEPILRFIRQNPRFFQEHLIICSVNASDGTTQLNQLSWLLKIIAIELKVMCNKSQTFYLQQLCRLLVAIPQHDKRACSDLSHLLPKATTSKMEESLNLFSGENVHLESLLVKLLTRFELTVEDVLNPKWSYFDNNALYNLLNNCQTDSNPKLINIKKLHHILIDEMGSTLQASSAVGQRQSIMQEIQKVLLHAVNLNNNRNAACALIRYVDAWRQVVQVLAVYVPFEVLSATEQQTLDIILLETICRKVSKANLLSEIGTYFSSTVLILMENLRKCHHKQKQQMNNEVDTSLLQTNVGSLKIILDHLIEWIVTSNANSMDMRINLYASLVTFLELLYADKSVKNAEIDSSFYVSRLDSTKVQNINDQNIFNLPTFSEKFIELLCYDCIGGHDAIRTLAMSTFSLLISITGNVHWIIYMESRGYLKNIIESILNSDEDLKMTLDPSPPSLKPLFLHIVKVSLLSQIALTKVGSELLLEQRILPCLSSMRTFSLHPEILKETQVPPHGLEDYLPSVGCRYLQIFVPTLHLCNALLTSLSAANLSVVEQIIYYFISHLDVMEFVLRSGNTSLSEQFLEELSCLTSVIARSASTNLAFMFKTTEGIQDNKAHLHRIQKLTLSLLPRFLLTTDVIKELLCDGDQKLPTFQTSDRLLYSFQIIANLVMYARNLIENNNVEHTTACVIFQPLLGDIFTSFSSRNNTHNEQFPTIGIIVQHLINTVNYYHEEKDKLNFLKRKVTEIPEMSNADLKELLSLPHKIYNVNTTRENALKYLNDKLNMKKQEFEYCDFIIDNALFVLWAHLDYYMLRAIPRVKHGDLPDLSTTLNLDVTLASTSEATWKVSADDISNLKRGLVTVFNDSFSRQLVETAQQGSEVKKQFVENLLRKIKRLIQFVPVK